MWIYNNKKKRPKTIVWPSDQLNIIDSFNWVVVVSLLLNIKIIMNTNTNIDINSTFIIFKIPTDNH